MVLSSIFKFIIVLRIADCYYYYCYYFLFFHTVFSSKVSHNVQKLVIIHLVFEHISLASTEEASCSSSAVPQATRVLPPARII